MALEHSFGSVVERKVVASCDLLLCSCGLLGYVRSSTEFSEAIL